MKDKNKNNYDKNDDNNKGNKAAISSILLLLRKLIKINAMRKIMIVAMIIIGVSIIISYENQYDRIRVVQINNN